MTNKPWKNIHSDFDYQGRDWETNYQQKWQENNFTCEQTADWINSGMKPQDAQFCAWLRDIRQLDVLTVLNFGDIKALRTDYESSLDKDQIIKNLQEQISQLTTNLEEAKKEVQQLNIALLHQQGISSKKTQTKQAIREEFAEEINRLEKENQELEKSLNNLNNLATKNKDLAQQITNLETILLNKEQIITGLELLLSQNNSPSAWLEKHGGKLLLITGISLTAYFLLIKK